MVTLFPWLQALLWGVRAVSVSSLLWRVARSLSLKRWRRGHINYATPRKRVGAILSPSTWTRVSRFRSRRGQCPGWFRPTQ